MQNCSKFGQNNFKKINSSHPTQSLVIQFFSRLIETLKIEKKSYVSISHISFRYYSFLFYYSYWQVIGWVEIIFSVKQNEISWTVLTNWQN